MMRTFNWQYFVFRITLSGCHRNVLRLHGETA